MSESIKRELRRQEELLAEKMDWVTMTFAPKLSLGDLRFLVQALSNLLHEREGEELKWID